MEIQQRKTVLSAIQPTGDLHLGNYFGAISNWVKLQDQFQCYFGVVNYHSMTMPYKPAQLQENTWKMAFMVMACGVRPEHMFIQSLIPEHVELSWILGCLCSYGELGRMTQFKDKSAQLDKENLVSAGLFYYPVLQAADILAYKADYVPVGKDQEQHLELTRNIAERFNKLVGRPYFALPEGLYTETPKILSLADPTKKMGKSYGEKHYINLFANDEEIVKKVKSAVTDSGDTPAGTLSPGVSNLFEILKACNAHEERSSMIQAFENQTLKYADLKDAVSRAILRLVAPFRESYHEINSDKKKYKSILQDSSAQIRKKVIQHLREIKELAGLANIKNQL